MLWSLVGLAFALQEVPPPRGVNDMVLGTAEQFRVPGPARVCLMETSIDLLPGESAYLEYLGIHWGGIRVVRRDGAFLVKEGSWAEPRRPRLEEDWRGRTIARARRGGRPAYLIYAPSDYPPYERPVLWVEGDALGRSHDRAILDRIIVHPGPPAGCRRRFRYGWDVILAPAGEEQP